MHLSPMSVRKNIIPSLSSLNILAAQIEPVIQFLIVIAR